MSHIAQDLSEKLINYRKEIHALDQKILELLAERMKLAKKIGRVKKTIGFSIEDSTQEKKVFDLNIKLGKKLGLEESLVLSLTKELIELSKKCQRLE